MDMDNEPTPKLECGEVFALLSEYLDQELTPQMMKCIGGHIAACDPCVGFLESLRKSIALCRAYQPQEPAPAISDDVHQKLRTAYEDMLKRVDHELPDTRRG